VRTIPTGIAVDDLAELPAVDPRPLAGWPPDSVVVAALGRLASEKSVDVLIEAFADVARTDPLARLLVVGSGPSEAGLRRRAGETDLAGRVHLTGQRPRLEALALIKGADLFMAASRTETQGLVLAEALTVGLPVVALDGPGVSDSVRDGVDGVIVPADPAADRRGRLAEAVRGMCGDPHGRASLAAAARAGADRFSVSARIGEVVALYRELLAERG
jgi:glycosyltransferase involved in cell wall biosynthesis